MRCKLLCALLSAVLPFQALALPNRPAPRISDYVEPLTLFEELKLPEGTKTKVPDLNRRPRDPSVFGVGPLWIYDADAMVRVKLFIEGAERRSDDRAAQSWRNGWNDAETTYETLLHMAREDAAEQRGLAKGHAQRAEEWKAKAKETESPWSFVGLVGAGLLCAGAGLGIGYLAWGR